jgi:predicted DsbA family dithiol-disulfide isomerase
MTDKVIIYADYVCPYCLLQLDILEQLEREAGVELDWRAFELRPDPVPTLEPRGAYLINTWRDSGISTGGPTWYSDSASAGTAALSPRLRRR